MLKTNKLAMRAAVACCAVLILLSGLHVLEYHRKYTENWMRFALRKENVVIALSTTPHRINHIQHNLELLHLQNMPIKAIYVSIPYVFKRDNIKYEIPDWLQEDKRITILRTEDYGPATKILGVLSNVDLPTNTIIISVDDDADYPSNLALHLAYRAKHNPRAAIGLSGVNIDYDASGVVAADSKNGLININSANISVTALQGFAGVAYRPRFFDHLIFDIVDTPRECINSDDLYLSFYLARKNIPRYTFKSKYLKVKDISSLELGTKADALHRQFSSEADRHRNCVAFMKQQYPEVVF